MPRGPVPHASPTSSSLVEEGLTSKLPKFRIACLKVIVAVYSFSLCVVLLKVCTGVSAPLPCYQPYFSAGKASRPVPGHRIAGRSWNSLVVRAVIIRIGFLRILYYIYNEEP